MRAQNSIAAKRRNMFVATGARCMARRLKAALKPPVDPKIPPEDAQTVSRVLYDIIREHGPLTVAEVWDHSKVAGLRALTSKMHMKIMLKWMKERQMLKVICNPNGPYMPFVYSLGSTKP